MMKKILLSLYLAIAVPLIPYEARATVTAHDGEDRYVGNGSTTVFAYGFKVLSSADIKVLVNGVLQTLTTHYTVSGVGASNGGNVTFVTAPANALAVTIIRNQPVSQLTNYIANESYNPLRVMQDLDKITMVAQMLSERIQRVPILAEKSTYNSISLPDPVSQKYLRWNTGLTGLENADLVSGVSVPAFTTGSIPFATGTSSLGEDNAKLFWNNTTKRMGIGTNAPAYHLDVIGSINVPNSASEGIRFGGTGVLAHSTDPAQGVVAFQPSANSATIAIHLTPTIGTLPTGTIAEYVLHRTLDQAFGGNYGRWSFTALGSSVGNASGIYAEWGGTVTPTPFIFSIGVENPASTFTSYEPLRLMDGTDLGNVGFCITGTSATPRDCVQLISQNVSGAGTRNSHAVVWSGKSNDGSNHRVDWKGFTSVTSNAGASSFLIQNRIDAASYATHLDLLGVASAVNFARIAAAATGGAVAISAQGETNVSLTLAAKGTGTADLIAQGATAFRAVGAVSGVNFLQATNSATGSPVQLGAVGSDANIQINLVPKGTSGVNITGPLAGINGATPFNGTKTVRASGGAADCTLVFTTGVLTGGTC